MNYTLKGSTMRGLLGIAFGFAALMTILPHASAQSWPNKPIRMIVPFSAGGGTDFIARLMAQHLSTRLGQQVFVENRAGANGALGLQALKQSAPDGYTIAATSDTPLAVNPTLQPSVPYGPEDFIPVASLVRFPGVLAVHPSAPFRNISELIAAAKAKPGSLAYSSGGIGNSTHLAMELFSMQAGVKLLHVPYKGGGPAALGLIAGEVQIAFSNVQTTLQNIREGQLIPLGVGEVDRVAALPEVPTIADSLPGFSVAPWVGIIVPAKTPKVIVDRLNKEVTAVMNEPEVVKVLNDQQVTPFPLDQAAFAALVKSDTDKWAKVIKAAKIKEE
jgi:tripartite-type tricarboxylate transporter receptor subunit TctC